MLQQLIFMEESAVRHRLPQQRQEKFENSELEKKKKNKGEVCEKSVLSSAKLPHRELKK